MKSLKEFITENLENSTIILVHENTEQNNKYQDNADTNKTNENNENILKGQSNAEKDSKED
ncbi:hypothetical protein [Chryseobacterium sp.]|uniref:hypothetical protein n=1 Tax=Chryseobacterium sp. TaxID=1871047 RepID=UPI000ED37F88|nr:hypothetical protein [Chryseobacterium sp.]HCA06927.1 hypothetical protein [Chryseobacterium sp.]